jgi:hypothetical protein
MTDEQCPDEIVPDKSTRFSWFPVIENEPAESCLYVSGVLRKVVLVDLSGTISSGHC